jgi:hypothetical protein
MRYIALKRIYLLCIDQWDLCGITIRKKLILQSPYTCSIQLHENKAYQQNMKQKNIIYAEFLRMEDVKLRP